jgi:tRNA(Ile)-lysidine synthase
MMIVLAAWAKAQGERSPRLSVATIDHGLRAEAAGEAAYVGEISAQLGLDHAVLRWEGAKSMTGLQEAAREARYTLLAAHRRVIGADALVLAHHADDQAETILMRLTAGSGLTGLGGMEHEARLQDMLVLRPFLDVAGSRLRATLEKAGIRPMEDPSNHNARFTRVRFRKAMPLLEAEGLDRVRLGRLASRMQRADKALTVFSDRVWLSVQLPSKKGARFAAGLWAEPDEIILRVLGKGIRVVNPAHAVDLFRLEDLFNALKTARFKGISLRRTLSGTVITLTSNGSILIRPEGPRGRGD